MRNKELDGLRGLAAMAVALGHCNTIATGYDIWTKDISDFPKMSMTDIIGRLGHVIFPADAAVVIFFVMSGYVLWGSLLKRSPSFVSSGVPFLIHRIYRILPASILTVLILGFFLQASGQDVVLNAFLLNRHLNLNGNLWTLQVEIAASVCLFFLYSLCSKKTFILLPVMLITWAFVHLLNHAFLSFSAVFLFGIALHYTPSKFYRSVILMITAYVVLISADLILHRGALARDVSSIAAMMIVGSVIHIKPRFLNTRFIQILAKLSYSFYLTHVFGLIAASYLRTVFEFSIQNCFINFLYLAIVSVGIALPVSWILHVLIEKPGIIAGAYVSEKYGNYVQKITGLIAHLGIRVRQAALLTPSSNT